VIGLPGAVLVVAAPGRPAVTVCPVSARLRDDRPAQQSQQPISHKITNYSCRV